MAAGLYTSTLFHTIMIMIVDEVTDMYLSTKVLIVRLLIFPYFAMTGIDTACVMALMTSAWPGCLGLSSLNLSSQIKMLVKIPVH